MGLEEMRRSDREPKIPRADVFIFGTRLYVKTFLAKAPDFKGTDI
jgi:hypothetical protein